MADGMPARRPGRLRPVAIVALGALLGAAGCGSSPPAYTLIASAAQGCEAQGQALASYLSTGKPASDDLAHGSQREAVLALSKAQQPVYISQTADRLIQACGQQAMAQAQARQSAAAQASAQAEAQAAASKQAASDNAADAAAQSACQQVRGSWIGPGDGQPAVNARCSYVQYLGSDGQTYNLTLDFSPAGTPIAPGDTGSATEQQCTSGTYPDGSAGPVTGQPGQWDSPLGLCLLPG